MTVVFHFYICIALYALVGFKMYSMTNSELWTSKLAKYRFRQYIICFAIIKRREYNFRLNHV